MEYKINLEMLSDNTYKEIEVDVYKKTPGYEDKNSFEVVDTFVLNDDAILSGDIEYPA